MHERLRLLRSTPIRLAVVFGLLSVFTFLAAGAVAYRLISVQLAHWLDRNLRDTYALVAATYAQNDLEDLVSTVDSYARLNKHGERVFSLVAPDGSRLAGSFTAPALPDGFSMLPARTPGIRPPVPYRVYAGTVGGNRLVVGWNFDETDELTEIVMTSLVWATVFVILLAVLVAVFLAYRAQQRLDAIAGAIERVGQGQLDAQIPLIGNGDDIDRVAEQINAALTRLASLVEGMRQVSSDIAHDLKTPLNRLQMTLEAAAGQSGIDSDTQDLLGEARQESSQINATFDALLRIAQIEAGARKARFREVDLAEVLRSIADIYEEVAEDDGKTLTLRLPDGEPAPVWGDRDLLMQMFANLVENALRHCPPGTTVELGLAGTGSGQVVASVRDNGPGIPVEDHERVFRRLYRLDKSRTTPGTGLGLSLVRAIADLHGVAVDLLSGQPGLIVRLRFPTGVKA